MKTKTKGVKFPMGQVAVLLIGLLLAFSAGVSADNISENQTNDTGMVCTPGETQSCIAGNGCDGTQICNQNGTWGSCYTSLKKCVDETCRTVCPNGCTDECKESYCVGDEYFECVLSTGDGCYKKTSRGKVDGKCGYVEQGANDMASENSEQDEDNTGESEETNANPSAPHFSSKAMSADEKSPGRIAVQVTNIMGNPSIDAQIILEVPDDVEVSGSVGALEGKASYNTIKLDIPAGGVTYVEIPFTAKNPGDYRMSATMYWKWKGDDYLHQIGFDHTVRINENTGEVCIQKPSDESCNPVVEEGEGGSKYFPDPTSNQILFVVVGLLGIAVIVGIAKKSQVLLKKKD